MVVRYFMRKKMVVSDGFFVHEKHEKSEMKKIAINEIDKMHRDFLPLSFLSITFVS